MTAKGESNVKIANEASQMPGAGVRTRPQPLGEKQQEAHVPSTGASGIGSAEPDRPDPEEVAQQQIDALDKRYDQSLRQAAKVGWAAVGAAVIGLGFFLAALWIAWSSRLEEYESPAPLTFWSGVAMEALAAVVFYVHRNLLAHLAEMQTRLDRMRRYLLAISVCDRAEESVLSNTRADLVRAISGSGPIGS
jgi:hypothetical protein